MLTPVDRPTVIWLISFTLESELGRPLPGGGGGMKVKRRVFGVGGFVKMDPWFHLTYLFPDNL